MEYPNHNIDLLKRREKAEKLLAQSIVEQDKDPAPKPPSLNRAMRRKLAHKIRRKKI